MLEIQFSVPGQDAYTQRFGPGRYSIGRGLSADIRIRHDSVAKRHALLNIGAHRVLMGELGSADSVRRNGVVFSGFVPVIEGDRFELGECQLHILGGAPVPGSVKPRPAADEPSVRSQLQIHAPANELKALQENVQELVLRELDLFRRTALNGLANADLRSEARQAIETLIASGAIRLPSHIESAAFIDAMTAEIMGYGPIECLLGDETISEIMVNGPNQVYVERAGRLSEVAARFTNRESLMRVIERIVSPLGRRIDEGAPMVDARLPDGSRVNAVIPPLSLIGPILTIRKFTRHRFTLDDLVAVGTLTAAMAAFLQICVRYRKNIVIAGGTGSGKTTFLNALSATIAAGERIVTIEDAAELRLDQPHVVALEARPPNVEGRGEITIRDLVRNALRMRPDRIVVGECRGGEALDMLQAMNTGHDGSMTTGHANSPRDLLSRLEVMVLMAGMDLPVRAIREQIAAAVNIVIQLARCSDGRRRVVSIVEVDGMEGDVILTQPLFAFKQRGLNASGEVLGGHAACGQAPGFYEELGEAGVALDRSIFEGPALADGASS